VTENFVSKEKTWEHRGRGKQVEKVNTRYDLTQKKTYTLYIQRHTDTDCVQIGVTLLDGSPACYWH